MEIGTLVAVFNEAELAPSTFIGLARYVGDAVIYFIVTPDKEYFACPNREARPTEAVAEQFHGKIEVWEKQAKLFLQTGGVRYGCEVCYVEYAEVKRLVDPVLRAREKVLHN